MDTQTLDSSKTQPLPTVATNATFWQRLTTCILDSLILGGIGSVINSVLGLSADFNFNDPGISGDYISKMLISSVISLILYFVYYSLDLRSGSVGKIANKLQVIDDKTGKQITMNKNLLRTLCKQIPLNSLISLFTINNRADKKALHDIIMKTSVVKKA